VNKYGNFCLKQDERMKKTYISPSSQFVELHICNILAGSAQGGVNPDSMNNEGEETLSSRRRSPFWDDDENMD
jgi:hypothetical protein